MSTHGRGLLIGSMALVIGTLSGVEVGAQPGQQERQQPGITWSRDEIFDAVAPVRAGHELTPSSWPGGARVAVCFSFDVDNETLSLARGNVGPGPLSAGEFGAMAGLPRVLDLLKRQNIPASFFIPAVSAMLHPKMIEMIREPGVHEIGVHGWIHESLPALDDRAEEERLLKQAIDYLTEVLGSRPVGYRAPAWAFSQYTMELVQSAGFLYDSSLMAMDEPYSLIANGEAVGLVELPVDWILDDYPYFGPNASGSAPNPEAPFQVYRDEFDEAYDEGTMFMLTMHPHIIGHRSRIRHLEELMSYMKGRPGVWFATAEQIARYVKKEKQESSQ
jgi:peptidoglycan/xylan/chitin deacetylase (PgdA/CDA1 family)